ncbi:MAG: cation:proton antiporter [Epsilonproteobacteria bacterium]|nr:cation:proton antiporter [Campylobacterota bacterium]
MEHLLSILLATIFIATIFNVILKKFDIPTIIGYIFAGLIINYMFDLMHIDKETLSHLAEFGIVFLMFTIGLEFSIKHLDSMKKEVFLFGSLQVMISGLLFTALAYFILEVEVKTAIILGFALSLSSTAIVLKMLNERNEIHSGYGRITLGILLFQDLAVIPILLMISIFTSNGDSVSLLLLKTLGSAIIVFFILFIGGKMILNRFFNWIMTTNSEEIFLVSVLFVVIGASFIAEVFGFSYSLGAFIAGMTIAETKYKYRVEADLIPFRDILLGIFFVTIGMQIDLSAVVSYWHMILLLLVVIMVLKALIIFGILRTQIQRRTSLKTALALFQVGEFSLAVLALAHNNQLISDNHNQIMIVTVVISMIMTPFVIKNIKNIVDRFSPEKELRTDLIASAGYKDHIIICGYGSMGQLIAQHFKYLGLSYIILEHDYELVKLGKSKKEPIILANAMQIGTLEAVNIRSSFAVIVAIDNAFKLRLTCEAISAIDVNINTVVKVKNDSHQKIIEGLNVNHIINESQEMAKILTKEVLNCEIKNT